MHKVNNQMNIPSFVKNDEIELSAWLEKIIEAFRKHKIQFLFGAGMSCDDNNDLPLGKELTKIMLKEFFPKTSEYKPTDIVLNEMINKYPFEIIAEALSDSLPNKRIGLSELLKDHIVGKSINPPDAYQNFADLRNIFKWPKEVYTTNFDHLFKETFQDGASEIHHENTSEYQNAVDSELIPIIHLHGNLESGNYQITETDYYDNRKSTLMARFKTALRSNDVFIFVGFSLNDFDFKDVYREYLKAIDDGMVNDKTAFFVSPPDNHHDYLLGKRIWSVRKMNWIPYTAQEFFMRLNIAHKNLSEGKSKEKIGQLYSRTPADTEQLIYEIQNLLLISEKEAIQYLLEAKNQFV